MSIIYTEGYKMLNEENWKSRYRLMCSRCYNLSAKDYKYYGASGSYVSEKWSTFDKFLSFLKEHPYLRDEYQIDKDLLVKGNKEYGPDTCVFLPKEINYFMTNRKTERGSYPLGVCWSKAKSKFVAASREGGKKVFLGTFDDPITAFHVYKAFKEGLAKKLAEKYKDSIDPRAYNALMSWEVNIDD